MQVPTGRGGLLTSECFKRQVPALSVAVEARKIQASNPCQLPPNLAEYVLAFPYPLRDRLRNSGPDAALASSSRAELAMTSKSYSLDSTVGFMSSIAS